MRRILTRTEEEEETVGSVKGSDTGATQGKFEYGDFYGHMPHSRGVRTICGVRQHCGEMNRKCATMDPEDADDLVMQTEGETL